MLILRTWCGRTCGKQDGSDRHERAAGSLPQRGGPRGSREVGDAAGAGGAAPAALHVGGDADCALEPGAGPAARVRRGDPGRGPSGGAARASAARRCRRRHSGAASARAGGGRDGDRRTESGCEQWSVNWRRRRREASWSTSCARCPASACSPRPRWSPRGRCAAVSPERHFASYLGLTPRKHSSGARRHLGAISKRGDTDLRMLLIHGARTVLWHAKRRPRDRSIVCAHGRCTNACGVTTRPPSRWPTSWRASSGPCGSTARVSQPFRWPEAPPGEERGARDATLSSP